MSYFRNGRKKTFGDPGERIVEWTLTQSEPIVGIRGHVTGSRISSIGFITLDTACQVPFDQAPDVVFTDDEVAIEESVEADQSRGATEQVQVASKKTPVEVAADEQEYSEYSLAAKVFVVAGIFIFVSICIFTLVRSK